MKNSKSHQSRSANDGIETVRNLYILLQTGFSDLPEYMPAKHVIHSYRCESLQFENGEIKYVQSGTCIGKMGTELAHTHSLENSTKGRFAEYRGQICYKKKYLMKLPFVTKVRSNSARQKSTTFPVFTNYSDYNAYYSIYWPTSLTTLVAHESTHLAVPCSVPLNKEMERHSHEFWVRYRQHQEFFRRCEVAGMLDHCIVGKNFPLDYSLL